MSLKPGDVVKQKGPTSKAVGPAMCVEERYTGITSSVCWTCRWFADNGQSRTRAFLEANLIPLAPEVAEDGVA